VISVGGLCIPAVCDVIPNCDRSRIQRLRAPQKRAFPRHGLCCRAAQGAEALLSQRNHPLDLAVRLTDAQKAECHTPGLIANLLENAASRTRVSVDILPNIDSDSLSSDQWYDYTHIKKENLRPNLLRDAFVLQLRRERAAVPVARLTNTQAAPSRSIPTPASSAGGGRPLLKDF
jgi:hypothetical protein